jgi:hypothetical protein
MVCLKKRVGLNEIRIILTTSKIKGLTFHIDNSKQKGD